MSRPIRTIAQISTAADVSYERAEELLLILELMDIAEQYGSGYRRTLTAESRYPVLDEREVKRRQVARRLDNRKPGQCAFCGQPYAPGTTPQSPRSRGFCTRTCQDEFHAMREVA